MLKRLSLLAAFLLISSVVCASSNEFLTINSNNRPEITLVSEVLVDQHQCHNTYGILQASVFTASANPVNGDTLILTDGSTTRTYYFGSGVGDVQVAIGGTKEITMASLATAITDDASGAWKAYVNTSLLDIAATTVTILHKTDGATSKIYGVWGTQSNAKVVDYTRKKDYSFATLSNMPSSLPSLSNFGMSRTVVNLITGEWHYVKGLSDEVGGKYSWNESDQGWLASVETNTTPKYIRASVSTITKENLTFYVASTGNDSNDCLSTTAACATIQSVLDRIPKDVRHRITINVGAGNFAGFYVAGFTFTTTGSSTSFSLAIQGADYTNFTPATGTGSGTFTSGDTQNGTDSGQTWTAHDFRGKIIYVNSSYYFIRDNTSTSLEIVGLSSTLNGKTYVIKDMSTVITSNISIPGGTACVYITANTGARGVYSSVYLNKLKIVPPSGSTYGVFTSESPIHASSVSIISPSSTYSMYILTCLNTRFSDIYTEGGAYGVYIGFINYVRGMERVYAYGASSFGFYLINCGFGTVSYLYADNGAYGIRAIASIINPVTGLYAKNNTSAGVQLLNMVVFTLVTGIIDSNADNFIINSASPVTEDNVAYGATSAYLQGVVISNGTRNGLAIASTTLVRLITVTGSGNGNYGIYVKYGSRVLFESTTTITGTSGDVRVGNTVGSYAVDFASDQSYITDLSEGSLIKRCSTMAF